MWPGAVPGIRGPDVFWEGEMNTGVRGIRRGGGEGGGRLGREGVLG